MSRHNDMQRIVDGLTKIEASSPEYDGDQKLAARTLVRQSVRFPIASVLANGSNVVAPNAQPSQQRMMANGRVLGVYVISTTAVTAANANNAQIALDKLAANGATSIVLATANTNTAIQGGTGDLAPGVPVALTLNATSAANRSFAKGDVVAPTITQNGAGVATGASIIQMDIELEGAATDYPV